MNQENKEITITIDCWDFKFERREKKNEYHLIEIERNDDACWNFKWWQIVVLNTIILRINGEILWVAIEEGWLKVERAKKLPLPMKLQAGEEAVIAIAKEKKIKEVIIDEIAARTAAKILGLTPKGTIYVLLKALAIKEITLEEFIDLLAKLLEEGFRLKEEIYLEAIKKAKEISQM